MQSACLLTFRNECFEKHFSVSLMSLAMGNFYVVVSKQKQVLNLHAQAELFRFCILFSISEKAYKRIEFVVIGFKQFSRTMEIQNDELNCDQNQIWIWTIFGEIIDFFAKMCEISGRTTRRFEMVYSVYSLCLTKLPSRNIRRTPIKIPHIRWFPKWQSFNGRNEFSRFAFVQ